jgi:hypothetical protein
MNSMKHMRSASRTMILKRLGIQSLTHAKRLEANSSQMSRWRQKRKAVSRAEGMEVHQLVYQDPIARTHWQLDQIAHQLNWVNFQLKKILEQEAVNQLPWQAIQSAVGPAMGRTRTIQNRLRQIWIRTQQLSSSESSEMSLS